VNELEFQRIIQLYPNMLLKIVIMIFKLPNTNSKFQLPIWLNGRIMRIFGFVYSWCEVDTFSLFCSGCLLWAETWTRSLRYFCFFSRQNITVKVWRLWCGMFFKTIQILKHYWEMRVIGHTRYTTSEIKKPIIFSHF
jgi:hypothetical protein